MALRQHRLLLMITRFFKEEKAYMGEKEWNKYKMLCEQYGISFTNDDGTFKSLREHLEDMAKLWKRLGNEEKELLSKEVVE